MSKELQSLSVVPAVVSKQTGWGKLLVFGLRDWPMIPSSTFELKASKSTPLAQNCLKNGIKIDNIRLDINVAALLASDNLCVQNRINILYHFTPIFPPKHDTSFNRAILHC